VEAAIHGSLVKLREAIKCGADIDGTHKSGDTPLILAAMGGHNEMVRVLIKNGANVEAKNSGGSTALMRAAARGRYETCRILLDEGKADPEAKDNHGHEVIMHAHIGHHEVVERHLRKHIDDMRARKQLTEESLKETADEVKTTEL
jgi:uncharacterized protein